MLRDGSSFVRISISYSSLILLPNLPTEFPSPTAFAPTPNLVELIRRSAARSIHGQMKILMSLASLVVSGTFIWASLVVTDAQGWARAVDWGMLLLRSGNNGAARACLASAKRRSRRYFCGHGRGLLPPTRRRFIRLGDDQWARVGFPCCAGSRTVCELVWGQDRMRAASPSRLGRFTNRLLLEALCGPSTPLSGSPRQPSEAVRVGSLRGSPSFCAATAVHCHVMAPLSLCAGRHPSPGALVFSPVCQRSPASSAS